MNQLFFHLPLNKVLPPLVICFVFFGCSTPGPKNAPSPESKVIENLHVFAVPVGLNLDQIPGPETFSVKVYAGNKESAKAVPIVAGTLEIITFDGSFFGRSNLPPVLRTWRFDTSQLEGYKFQAQIGPGYEFTLSWGTNKPTHTLMSVAARYTSPSGEIITSRPSSVTVIDK